jgi:hypothetical protein
LTGALGLTGLVGDPPKPEPLDPPKPDPLLDPKPDPLLEPKPEPEPLPEPRLKPLLDPVPDPLLLPKPLVVLPFAPVPLGPFMLPATAVIVFCVGS